MTAPALLFSLLAATAAAALYHLLLGRHPRQLASFWLAGVAGFAVGHFAAGLLPVDLPRLGQVHVIEALLMSLVAMSIVRYLRL